ncbi:unnamed protein product [Thlaspi arvense]|uniref:Ankyrin repeat protein n=1 Tax=Thlaspi arvense TaxID=13288 RepID=A0AAU9S9B5_THLAR|nr:unnamed protein product [Thlaspi arvense]
MEKEGVCDGIKLGDEIFPDEPYCSEMENETIASSQKNEGGEGSNVVFSREAPLIGKDPAGTNSGDCCGCSAKKLNFKGSEDLIEKKNIGQQQKKLNRQDRIEQGRLFQGAVTSLDWELAERLIQLADPQTLNDLLCVGLDSSKTHSLADSVTVMAQRLQERLQECNGDEILKVEAGAKVQKFTEWALKCIGFHSRCQGARDRVSDNPAAEIELQLSAFKMFLDLAGNHLSGRDFTEAFDAACFPLTLFSTSFDPGWASGASATVIQGLLGMLVEGGVDNVNQCFLEASHFGSTELVRVLLHIAQRNSLDVDVDLALGFASHYCKIGTMKCLVEEGNAIAFLGPLMRAAERGCMQVVQWFVKRGCRDMELCLALTAATSSCQVEVAAYLLPFVPPAVLTALSIEILKAAGERSGVSLQGVDFLLKSDFLGDSAATYSVADSIATSSEDESIPSDLKSFLREHWSESAFEKGRREGHENFMNFMRVLKKGESAYP